MRYKFIKIHNNGTVFRKKNSLSTGERIATDAANILREETFSPLLKRYIDANIIEQFHGYVDDCMSVVHGVDNSVLDALLNDLNAVDPTQFRWTMNASRQSVDFLDLTISKHRTFESTGRVETCSYKKPNCRSQMLAFASNHPTSCKLGIFRSETNRHLLNCSNPQDFYVKIAELRATLRKRGYPSSALPIVTYDEDKRSCMLERLRTARNRFEPASTSSQDVIVFKCPYGIHIRRLGIHKECTKLMQALKSHLNGLDARIILAHPIKQNLFLKTLRYNYPP